LLIITTEEILPVSMLGTYLVQTNPSVQTSIWTIGSTSNGGAGGVGGRICKSVIT